MGFRTDRYRYLRMKFRISRVDFSQICSSREVDCLSVDCVGRIGSRQLMEATAARPLAYQVSLDSFALALEHRETAMSCRREDLLRVSGEAIILST